MKIGIKSSGYTLNIINEKSESISTSVPVNSSAYYAANKLNKELAGTGVKVSARTEVLFGPLKTTSSGTLSFKLKGSNAEASREIDGGIETLECNLPLVLGAQKGLVEESDLIIPNMRGIMMARQKPLETIEAQNFEAESQNISYQKPDAKQEVKLVKPDEIDKLIDLLENEAKVI